jgi:hypothetical protein
LEVVAGDETWTTAARCHSVDLLRQWDDNEKLQRSCVLASRSLWWCHLGPVAELNAGGAPGFMQVVMVMRGSVE